MLRDFWLVETYFGETDAAQYVEEVVRRYGSEKVGAALKAGHLSVRTVFLRPGEGRALCTLSESGRKAVQTSTPVDLPV